jgi:nickel transport system substrate-binding protein
MLLSLLTACKNSGDDAPTDEPGTSVTELTFSESWDFSSGFYPVLTPENSTNTGPMSYASNFYETLVNYENGNFVPGLAESWEVSDDGTVYTFKLLEGVKFSDGEDFNAAALKKSMDVVPQNLGVYNGSYGVLSTLISEIVIVDDYTVELRITQPYYGVLKDLAVINPMGIVSPAMLEADGSPGEAFKTGTYGTGPYMYAGDGDGTTYAFVRNPYYSREQPDLDKFYVKVIPDNSAKLLALKSGEIDAIVNSDSLSYDGYFEMQSASGFEAALSPQESNTRFLVFNLNHTPFDDISVRAALARAIDKSAICDGLLSGLEDPADSLFPKSYPYCDIDVNVPTYDPDEAKTILENAGWTDTDDDGIREKDGVRLSGSMIYMTGSDTIVSDLALTIAAQAKEIGAELIPEGYDMMGLYGAMYGDFAVGLYHAYTLQYDPYTLMTNMNSELGADPFACQATAGIDEGNAIIKRLNSTPDETEVQDIYTQILNNITDNSIFIPISYIREIAVWNSDKIAEFSFAGYPTATNVARITTR